MIPSKIKTGDYIVNAGNGDDNNRADAMRVLKNNGCKSFRYEIFPEYTLCHGYLQEGLEFPKDETWH